MIIDGNVCTAKPIGVTTLTITSEMLLHQTGPIDRVRAGVTMAAISAPPAAPPTTRLIWARATSGSLGGFRVFRNSRIASTVIIPKATRWIVTTVTARIAGRARHNAVAPSANPRMTAANVSPGFDPSGPSRSFGIRNANSPDAVKPSADSTRIVVDPASPPPTADRNTTPTSPPIAAKSVPPSARRRSR